MADAERDRLELTNRIEQLEMDNKTLEAKNAQTIEENRDLLNQLESLNTMVADSEVHITSLEATLLSSQQIIRRLEGESERAESLERQLAFLEQEQEMLQNALSMTHEEARTAMSRWQRAERGIVDLQEQLERMEKETRQEREKHAEMLGRMEKQREVEKELNTAAGRLKGAAAAKSVGNGNGSNAVSHFVRDLLQDNTHLQQGIVELREMLMNSNDEIQALREQLMYHQPVDEQDSSVMQTLRAELESQESPNHTHTHTPTLSQELHIHHHYHVTPKQDARKSKKKRHILTPGVFIPPAQQSLPTTPPGTGWRPLNHARAQRDSVVSNRRWSVLSEQASEMASSSVPSSPRSNHRNSVFDSSMTVDSYPTSPVTSVDPMSPLWRGHRKHASNISNLSFNAPTAFSLDCNPPGQTHTIIEEADGAEEAPDSGMPTDESGADDEASSKGQGVVNDTELYGDEIDGDPRPAPRLRRALSHESIISLSGGLDIHTLRSRPSQLRLRHLTHATSITASSTIVASPMLSREYAKRSSALLRDTYASSPVGSLRAVSGPAPSAPANSSKLSAWAGWRPWRAVSAGADTPGRPRERQQPKDQGRTPGINQPGAIPGFDEYMAAHQKRDTGKVMPAEVDHEALEEGLAE
jgi:hypothetical protein